MPRVRKGTRNRALLDFEVAARAVRFVCRRYITTPADLDSRKITRLNVQHARQHATWLIRRYTSYDLPTIASLFGRSPRCIDGWLVKLELSVQASCTLGRDMVAEDCAFRAFEGGLGGDDKPW